MKNHRLLTIGLGLLFSIMALPTKAQVVNDNNEDGVVKMNANLSKYDFVQGEVLVKFKDANRIRVNTSRGLFRSTSSNSLTQVLQKYGAEMMEQLLPNENPNRSMHKTRAYNGEAIVERDLSQLYRVKLAAEHVQETMQLIDELNQMDDVEFAEPNYLLHTLEDITIDGITGSNPLATSQWYLQDYGVTQLWTEPIINPARPIIAIIDTGVDMTHPDLVDNLWTNVAEAEGENGYDNDGNGFKNDVHGWDFINNTPNVKDFNMHGTHVAGIAAAANNDIGIIGANPRALIMPVSVMQSDGTGDVATIVKGINYAVQNGATVLNLSLGTYANSRTLRQALENAYGSAVIVAAAGNDGTCINTPHHPIPCHGASPMFPAAYSFVLGVQATSSTGNLAPFSNYDDDGNLFSIVTTVMDPDGFNYELKAPGTNMYSTIPGGNYKTLQGTSMAAPLVAGSISFLKMVKNYDTQEILWGDLLHTDNIAQAYAVSNRPAELDLMKIMYGERKELSEETEEDYSGDGRIDAGETVSIYPVIRTTFGAASNIKLRLEMEDEFEDPNLVEIIIPEADFGIHLSAYSKGVSMNPLQLKVANNVANNRHIRMKLVATCDGTDKVWEHPFVLIVDNIIKLGGQIKEDMTLLGNNSYKFSTNVAVINGATLTFAPGAEVDFNGYSIDYSQGNIIAKGLPGKLIKLTNAYFTSNETIEYCYFMGDIISNTTIKNSIFDGSKNNSRSHGASKLEKCNISYYGPPKNASSPPTIVDLGKFNNFVNNDLSNYVYIDLEGNNTNQHLSNYFNNPTNPTIACLYATPADILANIDIYIGASKKETLESFIQDIRSGYGYAMVSLNEETIVDRPFAEAHGVVWKVIVNGFDAQEEFEQLPPLGVGRHKFEVYFNRPMNKEKIPQISFGVRDPWTQNAVAEDGSWNEEGTIYTAYKTISGKTKSDGLNRIYVYGAEDDEFFEIPYEKTRFNINIQVAGSMATGFMGEAGLGKVELSWNNENNDIEDAMGYNLYRYTLKGEGDEMVADTIRVNDSIIDIEDDTYTDYDVIPGETYYYFYRTLSTDLQEYDVSNVVAVTPLTSTKGDANGSGEVDVADIITTVNYAVGMDPKPFIFEAADMNADTQIDILDVIGIIQFLVNPNAAKEAMTMAEATAIYTIENGILYVESPVELAGVQVQLNMDEQREIKVADDLNGFEQTSAWLSDNDYIFLAYNMTGRTLSAGKHALLHIGDAELSTLRLSDAVGHNVQTEVGGGTATCIDAMGVKVMTQSGIFNLKGQKVAGKSGDLKKLPRGIYIINGEKVVK